MQIQQELIAEIAKEVVARLRQQAAPAVVGAPAAVAAPAPQNSAPIAPVPEPRDGVYNTVDEAVKAAAVAQKKIAAMSLAERGKLVSIVRSICAERSEELGKLELAETKVGRLDHKILKLNNMKYVLGIEGMAQGAMTDATGMCLVERAPWGVIGMMLPVTHSVPTMAANAINIISAGNTAVFGPHPSGKRVAQYAIQLFNRAFEAACGVTNVLCTTVEPTIESADQIFNHPGIALLCVTGGAAVVKAAAKSGKRVIAGGPGNPPVVVDETANLDRAARCIIEGAAFDNNLLCIGEKQIFVVASVADAFIAAMRRAGAVQLNPTAIDKLTKAAFTFDQSAGGCARAHVKKTFVGKDPHILAAAAGVMVPPGTQLLFGETAEDHPFVVEEQMMPFVPVIRVPDADAGIAASVKSEHGYRHTAIIHSNNIETVTRMARAMNTTIFVHNAGSPASLGAGGPGYLSHTIATPTGEGITTPLTFTRERRITVGNALRIV